MEANTGHGEKWRKDGRRRKKEEEKKSDQVVRERCAIQVAYKKQLLVRHAEKKKKSVPVVR